MNLHEAAQGVGWFVIVVFLGIAYVLWSDYRKEVRDAQKQTTKGP